MFKEGTTAAECLKALPSSLLAAVLIINNLTKSRDGKKNGEVHN